MSIIAVIVSLVLILFVYDEDGLESVSLVSCIDGDTIKVKDGSNIFKVRFLGIDTLEKDDETTDLGIKASEYTCSRVKDANKISLEYDSNSKKKDNYGRALAYVYVDGVNLNLELVHEGYARVYYIYDKYKYLDELCDNENYAYDNKLNIWKLDVKSYCHK